MTPGFRLFLVLAAVALLSLCAGCANGVEMDEAEIKACRTIGCTAWTEAELRTLIQRAGMEGYYKGWKDALAQSGRSL